MATLPKKKVTKVTPLRSKSRAVSPSSKEDTAEVDITTLSWVKRGKQRREIIVFIEGPETPTDISKKSGYSLNHTSRVLNEFRSRNLVECINPEQKTGRLYQLKPKGRLIRDAIKKS